MDEAGKPNEKLFESLQGTTNQVEIKNTSTLRLIVGLYKVHDHQTATGGMYIESYRDSIKFSQFSLIRIREIIKPSEIQSSLRPV